MCFTEIVRGFKSYSIFGQMSAKPIQKSKPYPTLYLQTRMSLISTLEKGAHHQVLDLSEELPNNSHHHHHHHSTLQHTHSQSSTAPAGTPVGSSGVVVPPPYSAAEARGGDAPLELRGSLDCWACSVLVTAQNLVIAAINACLAGLVFGLILTPAIVMVVFGFLCHSTVRSGRGKRQIVDQKDTL